MLLYFVAVAVLIGNIQAFTSKEADRYISTVLQNRFVEEAQYNRLDPYKLQDIKFGLNLTTGGVGNGTLTSGIVTNLSKVRPLANCTTPHWESTNVTFTCFIGFDVLKMNHTAEVETDEEILIFYTHVAITGTNITIQVTSNPQEDIPNLRLLFINRVGNMNVTASLGKADQFIRSEIRSVLVTKAHQDLHRILNGRFKDALAFSIYKTPIGLAV